MYVVVESYLTVNIYLVLINFAGVRYYMYYICLLTVFHNQECKNLICTSYMPFFNIHFRKHLNIPKNMEVIKCEC